MIKDRVLSLYDPHYPYNINFSTLLDFAADFKPTKFVLGGDIWDLGIISHWNEDNFKNKGFDLIKKQLRNESKGMGYQLDAFRKAMPKAEFIYILGNHEDWIRQFARKYVQMRDFSLETLLDLHKRRITTIPFDIPEKAFYKVGKLYFKHGHQYGGQFPAKQAVERSKKTIVIGHHHGHMTWGDYSDVDDNDFHLGILAPCYCHKNPEYGKGKPNKWTNGFITACIKPSGNFSLHIQLTDRLGHFMTQMGKEHTTF